MEGLTGFIYAPYVTIKLKIIWFYKLNQNSLYLLLQMDMYESVFHVLRTIKNTRFTLQN